jgi:hypothetical protein
MSGEDANINGWIDRLSSKYETNLQLGLRVTLDQKSQHELDANQALFMRSFVGAVAAIVI